MGAFTCCGATVFKALSRAAAKSASARLRQIGMGSTHPDWAIRAEICESCPLRVVRHNVSYCGDPFLEKVVREPTTEGCGCPTKAKAKSPDEHCPLDRRHLTAVQIGGHCTCKWCQALV